MSAIPRCKLSLQIDHLLLGSWCQQYPDANCHCRLIIFYWVHDVSNTRGASDLFLYICLYFVHTYKHDSLNIKTLMYKATVSMLQLIKFLTLSSSSNDPMFSRSCIWTKSSCCCIFLGYKYAFLKMLDSLTSFLGSDKRPIRTWPYMFVVVWMLGNGKRPVVI